MTPVGLFTQQAKQHFTIIVVIIIIVVLWKTSISCSIWHLFCSLWGQSSY